MDVHLDVDCGCCGDACSSQCQYQSGTATLVGYSEFADPSVPPKKYLVLTGSGTQGRCSTRSDNTTDGSDSITWSGSNYYDPLTAVKTIGGIGIVRQTMRACPANGFLYNVAMEEFIEQASNCYVNNTFTSRVALSVGTGLICPKQEDYSQTTITTGTLRLELSSEDTESAAEAVRGIGVQIKQVDGFATGIAAAIEEQAAAIA